MNEQDIKDLAPIMEEFPDTTFDDDGTFWITGIYLTTNNTSIAVSFDNHGNPIFRTKGLNTLSITAPNLTIICQDGRTAKKLYARWAKTPSGRLDEELSAKEDASPEGEPATQKDRQTD